MTATRSWNLGTGVCVELECDDCGYIFADLPAELADWPALWQTAHRAGWRGHPRAPGPHRCPECAALVGSAGPPPARTGSAPARTGSVRVTLSTPTPVTRISVAPVPPTTSESALTAAGFAPPAPDTGPPALDTGSPAVGTASPALGSAVPALDPSVSAATEQERRIPRSRAPREHGSPVGLA